MIKFNQFYITDKNGKSNCVVRSFCKLYEKKYEEVYKELCDIQKEKNYSSYNDIPTFEYYMKKNNTFQIESKKDIMIKDLKLNKGSYIVFCWDKKDFYHMVTIINNTLFDKDNKSKDLYVLQIYKLKK